ncbi:hypothetical protein VP501E541_P0048 [Vibrio phage 501E54-1]|nr:hypothetical protein VP501E541_P0048 [Vibrio phage 501E54-1]
MLSISKFNNKSTRTLRLFSDQKKENFNAIFSTRSCQYS